MDLSPPPNLILESFPVGPLECNCTLVGDPDTGCGLIIDPGWDLEQILGKVQELELHLVAAIHTHAHIDHINATLGVHQALNVPAALHEADLPLYEGIQEQAALLANWGLCVEAFTPPEPGRLLKDEDLVGQDAFEMEVLHTPGHTPGSLSFRLQTLAANILFSGDTLFQEGIGRTDLLGGDFQTLKTSIKRRLYTLPEATLVIPGHGPATTIAHERKHNPFVRG